MSEEVQFSIRSIDERYNFVISGDTVCGRDAGCEVVIPETSLSRRHARFFIKDAALYLEDIGSTNGTFVNGEQLGKEAKLVRYNDIVRFDILEFKVFVELAAAVQEQDGAEVVVAPGSKGEARAPRSWAVDEEVGQGTVVIDLGAKQRANEEREEGVSELDQSLLQNVDQPALIGISGADKGKVITFDVNGDAMSVWQIGRGADIDIVIEDPSVSEHQAQIIFEQGTWKLVDVISTNATYVNDEKILTHYLSNGDTLRFGATEYLFRISNKTEFRPRRASSNSRSKSLAWVGAATITLVGLLGAYYLLLS